MALRDELSGSCDAVMMISLGYVLANRPPSCLLHGRTLKRRSLSQSILLFLSQSERHSHTIDGISQIPFYLPDSVSLMGVGD